MTMLKKKQEFREESIAEKIYFMKRRKGITGQRFGNSIWN
jgi:hypothetical protein